nr:hypothetical protein [Sahlingia subintegra]
MKNIINITDKAQKEIQNLSNLQPNTKDDDRIKIRIGIKQGGCSGMSYFMNIETDKTIKQSDEIVEYPNFFLICDSKSILYLYGMSLDYESSLIGGGFKFSNPNAQQTCGCGQSFSV